MRLVLQRVRQASVTVNDSTVSSIGYGWLAFAGITHADTAEDVSAATDKILGLRMFSDDDGKFNRSILDIGGEILVVSQFTLYGDCRKGRRPSFTQAAPASQAEELYDLFVAQLQRQSVLKIESGQFQAHMEVASVNDGPVTMLIDTHKEF